MRDRVAASLLAAILLAGCARKGHDASSPRPPPRVEDMSWGAVELTVTADPPAVEFDRDVLLTLRLTAPARMDIPFPSLVDRLEGFVLNGSYENEPVTRDGKVTRELHVRLTPLLSREHRLAPMAMQYTDKSVQPPRAGWFPTRPIVFEVVPAVKEPGKDFRGNLAPVWIYPPATTALAWIAGALALAALAVGAYWLARRMHREVQLRRLSPRERALRELEELLAGDLITRNMAKEFYVRLTRIVRLYIERQHSVRAPEQTTQEFLAAVGHDPRFKPEVVRKLRDFLESADLVKFAAYLPGSEAVAQSTRTAREYVETDAEEAAAVAAARREAGGK